MTDAILRQVRRPVGGRVWAGLFLQVSHCLWVVPAVADLYGDGGTGMHKKSWPAGRRLLYGFFLFMAAGTVISRVHDSLTVPRVLTTTAKQKAVETLVEGRGTVKEKDCSICPVVPGLRIGGTAVEPGSQVEAGQVLFWYEPESLEEARAAVEQELEQIRLNIRREEISQEASGSVTQEELAARELELAQRALSEGELEYAGDQAECQQELERLEQDYQNDRERLEDELARQQDQSINSALLGLDTARNSRNRELRAARRKVEDLEEELGQVPEEDEARRQRLARDLQRAKEDLADVEDSWETEIDAARDQVDLVDDLEDRVRSGQTASQEELRRTYEQQVKQQQKELEEAGKALGKLRQAVEDARWQVETARRSDRAARLSEDQKRRMSALTVQGLLLDEKALERKLGRLEELAGREGRVQADQKGVVVDMEVKAGKTATGEELVSLAVGACRLEATFSKEDQQLAPGDLIQISIPGTGRKMEAVVGTMNLLGEKEGVFQADLGDMKLPLGTETDYTCRKQSEPFGQVIPLEGVRKDMEGYYCLVARLTSSVLGEEFRAERVNIRILYQGSREAAVEGSIFQEDRVIIGENQTIGAGDRVRPVSGF